MTSPRHKWPERNAHWREETGMSPDPIGVQVTSTDYEHREEMLKRIQLYGKMIVESLQEFKEKFGL